MVAEAKDDGSKLNCEKGACVSEKGKGINVNPMRIDDNEEN